MEIKQIKILVKRTQWQEVVISESEGFEMPKTAKQLVEMCEELKSDFAVQTDPANWTTPDCSGYELQSFDIVE